MSTDAELFTIGQLAGQTGLATRTVRFWSDAGLVPPAGRSAGGYRLYDTGAVARLELVRALRELGLGVEVVRAVLSRATTLGQVAAAHVTVLDQQIRVLRLRRAVLAAVATRGTITIEETLLMHKLSQLSARERQQMIDDFVDGVFAGVAPDSPGTGIARRMRQLPAELPDDPSPEQVDAWVELAELIADEDFRRRARTMALAGQQSSGRAGEQAGRQSGEQGAPPSLDLDYQAVQEHAGQALADGIAPGSPEGRSVLDRIVQAAERPLVLAQLEAFTDARVERYWQLLAVLNDQPPFPPAVPAFSWLIAALHADPGV
jgi:DNA-binding transcriptional MerR regulator